MTGFTFSKILDRPAEPWQDHGFTQDDISTFLSISFLLFLLDLVLTSFVAAGLSLYRPQVANAFGTTDTPSRRTVMWFVTLIAAMLYILTIAAFVLLGLAVTAYVGTVGWVVVGTAAVSAIIGLAAIAWQSPWMSAPPGQREFRDDEVATVLSGKAFSSRWDGAGSENPSDEMGARAVSGSQSQGEHAYEQDLRKRNEMGMRNVALAGVANGAAGH